MAETYSFGRISDGQVLEFANDIYAATDDGRLQIWVGSLQIIDVRKTDETSEDLPAELFETYGPSSFFISRFRWERPGDSVDYRRGQQWGFNQAQNGEGWIRSHSPFVDSFQIEAATLDSLNNLLPILQQRVQMAPPINSGQASGDLLAQSAAILNQMTAAVSGLVKHTSERQLDLDATRQQIENNAEAALATQRKELEEKAEAIREGLSEKEAKLAEREAELDDRENTHVRREFANGMASAAQDLLGQTLLAKSAKTFAIPLIISATLSIGLASFIAVEIEQITTLGRGVSEIATDAMKGDTQKTALISNINSQILFAQIRVGLQTLGLAALGWWSLRFASARYQSVNNWERDLHRFRLDTARAGFLVEGDLEARKVNSQGLPEVMLQSFSRGLFMSADTGHADTGEGMGATLNALLGQATEVRIGPNGAEVLVNGKGIKRAKQDATVS